MTAFIVSVDLLKSPRSMRFFTEKEALLDLAANNFRPNGHYAVLVLNDVYKVDHVPAVVKSEVDGVNA